MKSPTNYLQLITELYAPESKAEVRMPASAIASKLEEQSVALTGFLRTSKNFLLDVDKSQRFYELFESNEIGSIPFESFELPFPNSLFVFERPLVIQWSAMDNTGTDTTNKLVGMGVEETKLESGLGWYRCWLVFDDSTQEESILSHQFILFAYSPHNPDDTKPTLFQLDHYPCRDKKVCAVGDDGFYKPWVPQWLKLNNGAAPICQEILNREALINTLFYLVNKINTVVPIEVTRKKKVTDLFANWFKRLPLAYPYTKGNLPQDNYVLHLDGYRYKYDPDEIALGTGTKHRYRYDVRKHPRIINGHLTWVESHQRGSGTYIPKVYANRQTWYLPYVFMVAEKVSKIRLIEIIIVKIYTKFFTKKIIPS